MNGNTAGTDRTLITNAGRSRTLDIDERNKRYLITMAIRTACFFAFLIVPGWWKVAALMGAALLPAFAVLFANASDHRPPPLATAETDDEVGRGVLTAHHVIAGDIIATYADKGTEEDIA